METQLVTLLPSQIHPRATHDRNLKRFGVVVLVPTDFVGNKVSNFSYVKVFPYAASHVMNIRDQRILEKKKKNY